MILIYLWNGTTITINVQLELIPWKVFCDDVSDYVLEMIICLAKAIKLCLWNWIMIWIIKEEFLESRPKLWKRHFWTNGFFLPTTGDAGLKDVPDYIRKQGKYRRCYAWLWSFCFYHCFYLLNKRHEATGKGTPILNIQQYVQRWNKSLRG